VTMGPVKYHLGKFPPRELDWPRLVPLLGPAGVAVGRYDAILAAIPNPTVLLAPLTTQEAVLSSRIEGTQATMAEVPEYEAIGSPESYDPAKRAEIEEVLNYRRAMRQAVELMDKLPLCLRLVKSLHETLVSGVRGHDRARGKFRTIQNYIGIPGRPIEQARFIPIAPAKLEAGLGRWEKYLHESPADALVQLGIVHAEFESLHPFLDGNGRIGRMLIPLFLFERKLLREPMFYLSEYLEANRQEYYDRLLAVSRDDDWTGWCEYFLTAVTRQARQNETKAHAILELYQRRKEWIIDETRSPYAIRALDFVFKTPIFNVPDFVRSAGIPERSARRVLRVLSKRRLVKSIRTSTGRQGAAFVFSELLNITEGREVF